VNNIYKTISNLFDSLRVVLSKPRYLFLAVTLSLIVLSVAIWLPNLHLISNTLSSSHLTITEKTNIVTSFLGGLKTNFSTLSRTLTITTSILFGINMSLLIYYFQKRFRLEKTAGMSAAGMLSGLLGVGCASCGSVIISSLFGFGATASVIGIFPLKGQEFGLLGVVFLTTSIVVLAQKIQHPLFCAPGEKFKVNNL
jgi:hypothetical protein